MTHLPVLLVLIPLISGFVLLFAKQFVYQTQRVLAVISMLILLIISIYGLLYTLQTPHTVYMLGNWIAPFGIVLVLDKLSAVMILVTTLLAFVALGYAISENIDKKGEHFHVLFQLQLVGINGVFLTGDLFNLFVFFEILLLASFSLLLHGQSPQRTKAGLHYVIINLVGSTLFLFAVGTLYGILGTLNIADLAYKISVMPEDNVGVVAAAGLLLLFVFGLKAAMFPLYLWLPHAYANTSAPVAALFAVMTKIGIYSMVRVHGTLFSEHANSLAYYYAPWVLYLGLITLVMATLGVMSSTTLRRQVAYLVLASVATLLIAVGINSHASMSGMIYYMIHSTLVAGGFFLLADIIVKARGNEESLIHKTPDFKHSVLIGGLFFVFAVAISGLPPFSGFLGKVMILESAIEHKETFAVFFIVLASSLLMVVSLAKSGSHIFYDVKLEDKPLEEGTRKISFIMVMTLFSVVPILVLFAHPISAVTHQIASELFDTSSYIKAVLDINMELPPQ